MPLHEGRDSYVDCWKKGTFGREVSDARDEVMRLMHTIARGAIRCSSFRDVYSLRDTAKGVQHEGNDDCVQEASFNEISL